MNRDITLMPVMAKRCASCPFNDEAEGKVENEIATMVKHRCLTEHVSQICHHPRLIGKKETHLCRGARDFLLQIFFRVGLIEEETDEAWDKKLVEIRNIRH